MSNSKGLAQLKIASTCDDIKSLLLSKNMKYGNSALEPTRVFSKASPVEQLLVRIDDKLSRIQSGAGLVGDDEDVINDLIGYLVLLKIALGDQYSGHVTYEDIEECYQKEWFGEDIEPVFRNNGNKEEPASRLISYEQWVSEQSVGHRATE
jgi:hypothetical protein